MPPKRCQTQVETCSPPISSLLLLSLIIAFSTQPKTQAIDPSPAINFCVQILPCQLNALSGATIAAFFTSMSSMVAANGQRSRLSGKDLLGIGFITGITTYFMLSKTFCATN